MLEKIMTHKVAVSVLIFVVFFILYIIWNNYKKRKVVRIIEKLCSKMNVGMTVDIAMEQIQKESMFVFYHTINSLTEDTLHLHIIGIHAGTSYDIYIEKDEYPSGNRKENEWILKKLTTTIHKEHYDKITT